MDKIYNKNRKGQGFTAVFSGLLAALISVVFFMLFSLPGCDGDIPEQKIAAQDLGSLMDEYNIVAFLRTPVEIEGQRMTMSELIILYKQNPDNYRAKLKEKAWESLREIRDACAALKIDGSMTRLGQCAGFRIPCDAKEQKIPSLEKDITVKICLDAVYDPTRTIQYGGIQT